MTYMDLLLDILGQKLEEIQNMLDYSFPETGAVFREESEDVNPGDVLAGLMDCWECPLVKKCGIDEDSRGKSCAEYINYWIEEAEE